MHICDAHKLFHIAKWIYGISMVLLCFNCQCWGNSETIYGFHYKSSHSFISIEPYFRTHEFPASEFSYTTDPKAFRCKCFKLKCKYPQYGIIYRNSLHYIRENSTNIPCIRQTLQLQTFQWKRQKNAKWNDRETSPYALWERANRPHVCRGIITWFGLKRNIFI